MTSSRKSKKFWIWLGSAILLVVIVLGVTAARMVKGTQIDPNKLAKTQRGDVARSVVATGKIQPITKVEVKSKASGIVERLYVDINNRVHKGQQLAQLDQQEIVAQVEAQRAQLAAAQANVATYEANIEQDRVNAAAPDLPMYKATLDRNLQMQKEGIVSRQALDDTNKDYLAALTRRDSAKAQIGVDTAKLKQARAQVMQSQASLKQLEEQLSYTTIIAPMDGVILSRDVEIGDAVSSILVLGSTATLVMTEGDINQVYVQGKVDESDIAHVYMGQAARIKVESFRDRVFSGKVTKIAPLGVEKDNVTTFHGPGKCGQLRRAEECLRPSSRQDSKGRRPQSCCQGWLVEWIRHRDCERTSRRRPGSAATVTKVVLHLRFPSTVFGAQDWDERNQRRTPDADLLQSVHRRTPMSGSGHPLPVRITVPVHNSLK